ncbi:MAG: (E)-4-hydroxy-3-methylbut-2-enyl-diphosphate synthase [Muribaculaceae bacterium]|nr:(E)-4-hydroxy-3-methylbut-2-enyl-diphosphate synthase [Muribaculaceae bacterium]
MSVFDYNRRPTSTTRVGDVLIGSDYPVRLQSMNNTSTNDIAASADQAERIAAAGADIDRLTAQGEREARSMGEIRKELRRRGCQIPLVADIHFNPKAAFAAATEVEKVRINPGNFVDPGRVFKQLEYTDEEYARELQKIEDTFGPFLELCRKHSTAVRIGVNHGSLSDRIMSRYGDTPAGMVESAMEFLRVAVKHDFHDIVISIKASNTVVMVHTVRLLVDAMDKEDMHFPLHLGVTEAGDGEDGRVRSAAGIGTLLAQGIGDTIRVSLSEDPECEIPVARELADYIASRSNAPSIKGSTAPGYDPVNPQQRTTHRIGNVGGGSLPVVAGYDIIEPGTILADASLPHEQLVDIARTEPGKVMVLTSSHPNPVGELSAAIHALTASGIQIPVIARLTYNGLDPEKVVIRSSADFGALLLNGLIDGIDLVADTITEEARHRLALGILQATRRRISRTEFVSCPGCGRTLFDLQSTVKIVKEATSHLKGLKIAVMGCIVNGPGEMADADYGYVGAAAGNVSIYRGKTPVEKNIPSELALERLIALLKADGKWVDPE